MDSRFRELFNAMRKDMILMENFGYDEELLKTELSTCSEEAFREFERIYRERNKEDNDMNEREYIIAKAKELGVTAEELGVVPEVRTIKLIEPDEQLIHEVSEMIHDMEMDLELVRDYISEKYWEDLGITPPKKYKIVECEMQKTIYKKILVAIPQDEDEDNVDDYIGDLCTLDNDYPDDEEEWEINTTQIDEDDLTEDEVNNKGDDIWNYDDFAE